ncbi:hypothetical protein [Paenibacillus tyrfis]|uniref:hypothetical protein n=1 Tax=Paenibacillus tyrfis TaxID=1501230 RepID=UPI0020A15C8C|nr:hypothetical protein [Paenibacillus tyrfis]MCP1312414.1 hypothetical protein [Paenibacillus tyrfis]
MYGDYNKDFLKIRYETPWEEYPPRIRSTIATTWMQYKYDYLFKDGCINITGVFLAEEYLKAGMLNNIWMMLYGPGSEYFDDITNWNHFSDLRVIEEKKTNEQK